jgi:phosphoenolpyruvate phosphomutase / 2-hydroxyethylphosphonate cytidylyltransferase
MKINFLEYKKKFNKDGYFILKDLIKNGFNLVIYANQLLRAANPAMQNTAKTILKNSIAFEADKKIIPTKEIINLIKND